MSYVSASISTGYMAAPYGIMCASFPDIQAIGISMANPAPNLVPPDVEERQEFWKPMVAPRLEVEAAGRTLPTSCPHCGNELLAGSRVCPRCGADSQSATASETPGWAAAWNAFTSWRRVSGRSLSSLVTLAAGCACIVAALATSWVFKATTLLDWQAIQLWRIEWLLAAIAILLAGILLKKK